MSTTEFGCCCVRYVYDDRVALADDGGLIHPADFHVIISDMDGSVRGSDLVTENNGDCCYEGRDGKYFSAH